jgi:hypothetical protein
MPYAMKFLLFGVGLGAVISGSRSGYGAPHSQGPTWRNTKERSGFAHSDLGHNSHELPFIALSTFGGGGL